MAMPFSPAFAADDPACDSVEEVLEWTAELLSDLRDGDSGAYANGGRYVADAAEYAVDRMKAATWDESAVAAAMGLYVAGSAFHRGLGEPESGAADLLEFADALAAQAVPICGADIVPAFVRPGIGDARACDQVIEALEAAKRVLPTLAGEPGAPPPMLLLRAATEAEKAAGRAKASQWSGASVAALTALGEEARALQKDRARYSAATSAAFAALAAPAIAEAREICGDSVPRLD